MVKNTKKPVKIAKKSPAKQDWVKNYNMSGFCLSVLYFGAAEASLLEPFDSISDWLLSSTDIDWILQLREASRTKFVQQYQL